LLVDPCRGPGQRQRCNRGEKQPHIQFHHASFERQVLTTRNMALKTLMDSPDYRIMQECPHVTDVAQLKKTHDARAASLGKKPSRCHSRAGEQCR
jgi:hypothetical protein